MWLDELSGRALLLYKKFNCVYAYNFTKYLYFNYRELKIPLKSFNFLPFYCRGLEKCQPVLLTHGDSIEKVAETFRVIAQSRNFVTGIANDKLRLYGLQFHPEVDMTVNGKAMLRSFLFDISGLTPNFTMESRETACIRYIRDKVGTNKVLVSKIYTFIFFVFKIIK